MLPGDIQGPVLVLVKFGISGNLRFLSHAETVSVFQRACVRAGIKLRYSRGFNPRPKLSLPLPRPVGVVSDDDLLCLCIETSASSFDAEGLKAELSSQLPAGCELLSVRAVEGKRPPQPVSARYVLTVSKEYQHKKLRSGLRIIYH